MKKIMMLAMAVLLSFTVTAAYAEVNVKGSASTKYSGWLSDADKQRTIEKAEMNAIEAFFNDRVALPLWKIWVQSNNS